MIGTKITDEDAIKPSIRFSVKVYFVPSSCLKPIKYAPKENNIPNPRNNRIVILISLLFMIETFLH